jgi:two-component system, cell cycle response regulator
VAAIVSYQHGIEQYGESNPREVATAWRELSELQEGAGDVAAALRALRQALAAEKRFNDQAAILAVAKAEQKLEIDRLAANWTRIAEEDALTGLPNRRAYEQRIAQTLNALHVDEHLALVIVDVDHFKRVNDVHGHQTGDQVLRALAQTLKRAARDGDFVGRLGGEEFVLLVRCAAMSEARQLAARAIGEVRALNWRELCGVNAVTASAGVGLQSEITATEPNVIKALYVLADRRLYAAKKLGRDRVVAEG